MMKALQNLKTAWGLCAALPALACAAAEQGVHGYAMAIGDEAAASFSAHGREAFPMMSVVKFPLAIAVLHEVGQGRLSLAQTYSLTPEMLDAETWSPMLKQRPQGGNFTLGELLRWCVTKSDNNACNILFALAGGPENVQGFFRRRYGDGFPMAIVCSEDAFKDRDMMRANHITPCATVALLQDVCRAAQGRGDILLPEHARLLLGMMERTNTGAGRLRAGLSPDTKLAHKTGSSGTQEGHTIALNDVGVITLPDGRYACIASYIRDSCEGMAEMEAAHARLARKAEALLKAAGRP